MLLRIVLQLTLLVSTGTSACAQNATPNIIIFFIDDMGYGDLGCYGHPTSQTPHIDWMAERGVVLTQFYSSNPVCSPSRSSILTGRYPVRTGIWPGVLTPASIGGMPLSEITIAELVKPKGYNTYMIGKWHLGVGESGVYLPTRQGFQEYFGIPYSHYSCPCLRCFYPDLPCYTQCHIGDLVPCPLFHNETIIQQPADFLTLSGKYLNKAKELIGSSVGRREPFFLYYAFQHMHSPQFAGKNFTGYSLRGDFGDSLAEVDYSVGQILSFLEQLSIDDNTFVFLTSDNGPSLGGEVRSGNAGLLKCGKGTTYEGGMRVPGIAYWPGTITPRRSYDLATVLDLYPTVASLVGAPLPSGVDIDGVDMAGFLFTQPSQTVRESFVYYPRLTDPDDGFYAIRHNQFKAHFYTRGDDLSNRNNHDIDCPSSANLTKHNPPLLFNLYEDPSELYPLNVDEYLTEMNNIYSTASEARAFIKWAPSEINKGVDDSLEPCCNPGCQPFPDCCVCN